MSWLFSSSKASNSTGASPAVKTENTKLLLPTKADEPPPKPAPPAEPAPGLCRGLCRDVCKAADETHFLIINVALFVWHRLLCQPLTGDLGAARQIADVYWQYKSIVLNPIYWFIFLSSVFPFKLLGRWIIRLCSCNAHPDLGSEEYFAAEGRYGMLAVEVAQPSGSHAITELNFTRSCSTHAPLSHDTHRISSAQSAQTDESCAACALRGWRAAR
jgi:hypothetical protein